MHLEALGRPFYTLFTLVSRSWGHFTRYLTWVRTRALGVILFDKILCFLVSGAILYVIWRDCAPLLPFYTIKYTAPYGSGNVENKQKPSFRTRGVGGDGSHWRFCTCFLRAGAILYDTIRGDLSDGAILYDKIRIKSQK